MNTTQFDVAVIGAGIVGASCAFHLAQRGLRECLRTRDGRAPAWRRTEEVGSWLGR